MEKNSKRTFVALELNAPVKTTLSVLQEHIKNAHALKGSWVQPANLHLTLKFLGDTPVKHIDLLIKKIADCTKGFPTFQTQLTHIGTFPDNRSPRILWVDGDTTNTRIASLVENLENSFAALGFKKEGWEFRTHITLCRIKQLLDGTSFSTLKDSVNAGFTPLECTMDTVVFYESKLTPQGSAYTPIASYQLL